MKLATLPLATATSYTASAAASKRSDAPKSRDSYQQGSPVLENTINFAGMAAMAAGVAAVTTAFAPSGSGFGHAIRGLSLAAAATVGGAVVGGVAGESIANFASRTAHVSHSADERIGNSIGGLVLGGASGLIAGVASSFFNQGPVAAAATAGIAVAGLGVAVTIADKFHK